MLTGFPFPSAGFSEQGVRLLRGSNVKRGEVDWSDAITVFWPEVDGEIAKYSLRAGDLVIAMDGALVGRSFATLSEADVPSLLVQRVARLRGRSVVQPLLGQLVASQSFLDHVDSVKTHAAIPHISPVDIRQFAFRIPLDDAEQRAIAAALSDVDALLTKLDQLIAKKRDLKQAAMQQLLTGRTRLPGSWPEWGNHSAGALGSTYGGLAGKSKADFGVGDGKYVTFLNVIQNVVVDARLFEPVVIKPGEVQNEVREGDLLFNGSSETPEEVGLCAVVQEPLRGVFLNSFCFGFRLRNSAAANGLFLAYLFRSGVGRDLLRSLAQGATRYNLSKAAFLKLQLRLPAFDEQRAIAKVLSDMDAELAALEARREKTRQLKQGMMQALLTGRIRLV